MLKMKRGYIGNYNRDLQILSIIKKWIDDGECVSNNINLDVKFFNLLKKGIDVDISFDDTINPFSNELHDSIFDLQQNFLISMTSPIKITNVGRKFLNEYYDEIE